MPSPVNDISLCSTDDLWLHFMVPSLNRLSTFWTHIQSMFEWVWMFLAFKKFSYVSFQKRTQNPVFSNSYSLFFLLKFKALSKDRSKNNFQCQNEYWQICSELSLLEFFLLKWIFLGPRALSLTSLFKF